MIDEELLNEIKTVFDEADKTYIRFASLDGSACLPFINDPDDLDIHCFIDESFDGKPYKAIEGLKSVIRERVGDNVAVIAYRQGRYTKGVRRTEDITDWATQTPALPTFAYQFNFSIPLCGEKEAAFGDIDILGKDKADYLANLKHEINCESFDRQRQRTGRTKRLYHVLCGIYFIENNSYELTEEQKKNVNIAHDKTDGWEGLYEWAKEELEKLVR